MKQVWVESDILGNRHIMISIAGVTAKICSLYYVYPFTDNASLKEKARKLAIEYGATEPVEFKHAEIETLLSHGEE